MKNDIVALLKCLAYALFFAYFSWESIDFALNAKGNTEGYYNSLGNRLRPYQVLPFRIISFISIPLWLVGLLVSLKFALSKFANLLYQFKIYIKKRFSK